MSESDTPTRPLHDAGDPRKTKPLSEIYGAAATPQQAERAPTVKERLRAVLDTLRNPDNAVAAAIDGAAALAALGGSAASGYPEIALFAVPASQAVRPLIQEWRNQAAITKAIEGDYSPQGLTGDITSTVGRLVRALKSGEPYTWKDLIQRDSRDRALHYDKVK